MKQRIEPHKITKPIQLLAAWLIGLVLVNGSFLAAATSIAEPSWIRVLLTIACVINVPLFLAAIFLLQTKFRPEMQEDTYYSKYLESKTKTLRQEPDPEKQLALMRAELTQNNTRLNSLFNQIEEKFSRISDTLNQISSLAGLDESLLHKVRLLEKDIGKSEETLKYEKRLIEWAGISVEVNKQLGDYRIINDRLSDAGIVVKNEFGKDIPKFFQISFGKSIDIENIRNLLRALNGLNIDYLEYAPDAMHDRRIYIGSYSYEFGSCGRQLNNTLKDTIYKPSTTIEELQNLVIGKKEP